MVWFNALNRPWAPEGFGGTGCCHECPGWLGGGGQWPCRERQCGASWKSARKFGFGAGASHWSWGIAFAGLARRSIPAQECQQDAFALSLGAGKIFNTSTS
jgi:hypothetical protein